MNTKLEFPFLNSLKGFLKQYKFLLILIAAGVVLLLLPQKKEAKQETAAAGSAGMYENFSLEDLEKKLEKILSGIEGAGEVSVMLTIRSGMEQILAADREQTESGSEREMQEKTLVISTDSGEEVVLIGQNYPIFQGALIVCPGGDDPGVQLLLIRALSALTGLSTNRITVCKGSS